MTHKGRGPWHWTCAIYALSTTILTKMVEEEINKQQHLQHQLGLCLSLIFTLLTPPHYLLLYSFLTQCLLLSWTTSISIRSLSPSFPWPSLRASDAMNGL